MIGGIVTRPLGWIVRRLGVQTLLSVALLLVTLGSVVLGLVEVVRGLEAGLLLPVAVSGVLMGWVLAKSPLPGWLGGVLALVWGALGLAGVLLSLPFEIPIFAILLIVLGVIILVPELAGKRN